MGEHLISPNLHVIMVHFPLGIFVFGLFLEVFGLLFWRRSSARMAGRWMILFGALLAIPANFTGIDALKDVLTRTRGEGLTDQQWALLHKHILFTSIGTGVAALTAVLALGFENLWRRHWFVYAIALALLVGSAVLMTFGSHFGGEGIYLQGIAVKLKVHTAAGIDYYMPAQSTHILVSGLAVALGLGALGASLRKMSMIGKREEDAEAERELAALEAGGAPAAPLPPRRVTDDMSVARTLNADAAVEAARTPAGRFWILTTLVVAVAFGLGVWLMLQEEDFLSTHHPTPANISNEVWQTAMATSREPGKGIMQNRRGAHIALGAVLILLPLVLAAAVRWGARHRIIVGALCLLMVGVIAAQIWLGILLTHDDPEGPLLHFKPVPTSTADASQ